MERGFLAEEHRDQALSLGVSVRIKTHEIQARREDVDKPDDDVDSLILRDDIRKGDDQRYMEELLIEAMTVPDRPMVKKLLTVIGGHPNQ